MASILGIEPSVYIPRPIGPRINIVDVKTSLSIEEQYKKAGLIGVTADTNRPKNSCGIIVAVGRDGVTETLYSVGQMVYFDWHSGKEIIFQGTSFRCLDWNDVLNLVDEDEIPESYKEQVRKVLRGEEKAAE